MIIESEIMDNKAQTSFEYIIIVGVVMLIATVVTLIAVTVSSAAGSIKETSSVYSENVLKMLKSG